MTETIVVLSLLFVFYAYFGYPLLLLLFNVLEVGGAKSSATARASATGGSWVAPKLTVIITVRNEEKVIRSKLENTLRLTYAGQRVADYLRQGSSQLQVIVASDCSDDATDSIVAEFADDGVELVRLDIRGGKERAQQAAIAKSRGEIIVFTDGKIVLEGNVLQKFAEYFSDPQVGAVSSVDRVITDDGSSSGEGFYVRYEMWLRSLESSCHTLVGLSGSCFAVRKSVADRLAGDIPSDFAQLIEARKLGLRGVHAPDVVAGYKAVRTEKEEFSRKVRTVLRGITTLFARLEVLNPSKFGPMFSWQVASHKLSRWLVPWMLLFAFLGTVSLSHQSSNFLLLALLMVVFVMLAVAGFASERCRQSMMCKVPLFFLVANAAIFVAWLKFFSGTRAVTWTPSDKGRSL